MSKTNSNEDSKKDDSPKELPTSNTSANAKDLTSLGFPMPASA
jgi:hypothetical protein